MILAIVGDFVETEIGKMRSTTEPAVHFLISFVPSMKVMPHFSAVFFCNQKPF